MIVVNSVMSGFTNEMMVRLRGSFSDLMLECTGLDGFPDPDFHMAKLREIGKDKIIGMTPTVHVPAMFTFRVNDQWINRQIVLVGVEEKTAASASDMSQQTLHPENRKQLSFDLREKGYDVYDRNSPEQSKKRVDLENAGWGYRRYWAARQKHMDKLRAEQAAQQREIEGKAGPMDPFARANPGLVASDANPAGDAAKPRDPFASQPSTVNVFDPEKEQHTGIIVGKELVYHDGMARFMAIPGDDVKISFPTCGQPPKISSDNFTVVDIHESKMSGHDSNFVFMPLRRLQEMRGMIDPTSGIGRVNAIQIRLREDVDINALRAELAKAFPVGFYKIDTWQDKVGPLLAAVSMEKSVLNILLFLIIAVAGFGILAIFFMIVVEKTKDIGILKALGASRRGVLGIFLGYGLSLGIVGSGMGLILGLVFVWNLNTIRDWLEYFTQQKVFDPSIYYFYKIPTIIEPFTVCWIVGGALLIAVMASILPAIRASNLHPVQALRYE
jgi:lipoprotein-releasing system permease protein